MAGLIYNYFDLGDKNQKVCEEIQDLSYDVAIIMGGFAQSHLPVNSLYQVICSLHNFTTFLTTNNSFFTNS